MTVFWNAVASAGPHANTAPRSRQITTRTPRHSIFTGWMLLLMPNQQRETSEGSINTNQQLSRRKSQQTEILYAFHQHSLFFYVYIWHKPESSHCSCNYQYSQILQVKDYQTPCLLPNNIRFSKHLDTITKCSGSDFIPSLVQNQLAAQASSTGKLPLSLIFMVKTNAGMKVFNLNNAYKPRLGSRPQDHTY